MMRKSFSRVRLYLIFLVGALPTVTMGQGVAVIDPISGDHLTVISNDVHVAVESQVALVTARHTFANNVDSVVTTKYAFPMPESGSATLLRWKINDIWYEALFNPSPQDSTLGGPGDPVDATLTNYLGLTPLYFEIEQGLSPDSLLVVELTYVQLLPYEFGDVRFFYPNDYRPIQEEALLRQTLEFDLVSPRTIEEIELVSHSPTRLENNGSIATIGYEDENMPADADYLIRYSLSLSELGLFGFSTMLPDSLVGDDGARGFFSFVVEPDPSLNTETIDKVFTLIVDRSGSMRGSKIVQARDAAAFVVDHLNEGDFFNIVDFNSSVESFHTQHVPFTPTFRDQALAYISQMDAGGLTNISDAFGTAIPQFATAAKTAASIIVFFTDGMATTGIKDTPGILDHVNDLMTINEIDPIIFTFGIGPSVDRQLLTRLATEHKGLVEFLGDDEVEDRITNFYLRIRNPVALNTLVSFDPPVVSDTYPSPMPGLFKGQQVIVGGRYSTPGPVGITLSGEAFGRPVSFSYNLDLAPEPVPRYQFLTKIWAKLKITDLLVQYYLQDARSELADELRDEIVEISVAFGVISPFTSFRGGVEDGGQNSGGALSAEDQGFGGAIRDKPDILVLTGNYPNPFQTTTTITLNVSDHLFETAFFRIFDSLGRLVRVLSIQIRGPGMYEVVWDGLSSAGLPVPTGVYIYTAALGDMVLAGKMTRIR